MAKNPFACAECHLILTDGKDQCDRCPSAQVSSDWQGYVVIDLQGNDNITWTLTSSGMVNEGWIWTYGGDFSIDGQTITASGTGLATGWIDLVDGKEHHHTRPGTHQLGLNPKCPRLLWPYYHLVIQWKRCPHKREWIEKE